MRFKVIILISMMAVLFGLNMVLAQDPADEEVRGAFLTSREKTTPTSSARSRRRTVRRPAPTNTNSSANANTNANIKGKDNTNSNSVTPAPETALALGYTLFIRDANGDPVRVDPAEEFHTGERVRISLEPNVDGYLYVFHVEGDGQPQMIFPDWHLSNGENEVDAHVPYDVPSGFEKDERLRWFLFDSNPATEHLYIVVSREPLPSVPVGDALVSFCAANKTKCPWKPTPEIWASVQHALKADVQVAATNNFGQPQSDKEKVATTRGLGLDQSAPAPSVIRMNASTKAPVLVTVLDLIHK
ncbi:MAG: hypothetical protein QOD75_2323 [Blastocatellia bacterium]|jgi:hypothetical protein|nr:hypothetical protein [Blastocatellia bacterium]